LEDPTSGAGCESAKLSCEGRSMRLSRPEAPPPAIASPLRIAGGVFITATENVSSVRVAAGAFGFLIFSHAFEGPLIDQICDKDSGGYHDHNQHND
jgi:hypothetical protein